MTGWILPHAVPAAPRLRLVCLPWAGGGASAYRSWCDALAPEIEVVPLQPPGRENRLREPAAADFSLLLPDLLRTVAGLSDLPFALFGHSKGAHLAFTLARALRASGQPMPVRLFLSGRHAVGLPPELAPIGSLDDAELVAVIRQRYGGQILVDDPGLWQLILPTLRADVVATETYPDGDEPPLDVPITTLGGDNDVWVSPEALAGWQRQTSGPFDQHIFRGGHFYFLDTPGPVLAIIRERLRSTPGATLRA